MTKPGNAGKKIAIVAHTAPPLISGGISSAHYNLFRLLKKTGFSVRVYTFGDHYSRTRSEPEIIRNGSPVFLLKLLGAIRVLYSFILKKVERVEFANRLPYILESAVGSLRIRKHLRQFRPDVLLIPDHGASGFFIKKTVGCRTIFFSHHNSERFLGESLLGHFSRTDTRIATLMERKTLCKVDAVICPSVYMKEVFHKTHDFSGPVAVLPNIVDNKLIASIPVFDIRNEIDLPMQAPVIYIPSAGIRLKGSRFVFEIVRRITASYDGELGFYLSGSITDQSLRRELSFIPAKAKIYMPGNVRYEDNIAIVKSCSFCISPTLIESFGMAILEANFCGLPVVTFEVGGNKDIITTGSNGFLVPFLDLEKLLLYSVELLDEGLRNVMRRKTMDILHSKFNSENLIKQYIDFLFGIRK